MDAAGGDAATAPATAALGTACAAELGDAAVTTLDAAGATTLPEATEVTIGFTSARESGCDSAGRDPPRESATPTPTMASTPAPAPIAKRPRRPSAGAVDVRDAVIAVSAAAVGASARALVVAVCGFELTGESPLGVEGRP